ncbi:hypothetical protein NAC44_13220 [Allorhizobium sp. BGMRC 0089]|uniref:hypothetical protein n=1 Tax=Allorhizobium sonneratiae TaxID=2934936 RepID=UPI0020332E58|nr:hypothetical protein [Allorhizobium sonneratiae]MCM2293284.1 hypothetical protein [Allorhizobium sonneratiae]
MIAFAIGIVSSLRFPVLVFALIVFLSICVYAVIRLSQGDGVLSVILWSLLYECAFAAGVIAVVMIRFFTARLRSGRTGEGRVKSENEIGLQPFFTMDMLLILGSALLGFWD